MQIPLPMGSDFPRIDGELARRLAHEIRSPLGVIVGGLDEVTSRPDIPADASGFLQLARRSAGRLERVVHRMEWIAWLQSGRIDEAEQPEPLREVVERGVREAEAFAGRRAVGVTVTHASDATSRVRGSRATRQVVQELVHNAIRHARTRVDVSVEAGSDGARVRIEHDGAPLDPERLALEDASTHASGLGLGLWLCRELSSHVGAKLEIDASGVALVLP